jgi:hypothetical protein
VIGITEAILHEASAIREPAPGGRFTKFPEA